MLTEIFIKNDPESIHVAKTRVNLFRIPVREIKRRIISENIVALASPGIVATVIALEDDDFRARRLDNGVNDCLDLRICIAYIIFESLRAAQHFGAIDQLFGVRISGRVKEKWKMRHDQVSVNKVWSFLRGPCGDAGQGIKYHLVERPELLQQFFAVFLLAADELLPEWGEQDRKDVPPQAFPQTVVENNFPAGGAEVTQFLYRRLAG